MPSPLEVAFETALHALDARDEPTIGLIFEVMHRMKFTGSFTVHCDRGTPQHVEIGRPIRVDLTRRARAHVDP